MATAAAWIVPCPSGCLLRSRRSSSPASKAVLRSSCYSPSFDFVLRRKILSTRIPHSLITAPPQRLAFFVAAPCVPDDPFKYPYTTPRLHDARNDNRLPLPTTLTCNHALYLQYPSCLPHWCVSPRPRAVCASSSQLFFKNFCGAAVVGAWSIIVLGIALHFQISFVSSDSRTYSCFLSTWPPQKRPAR